MSPPMNVHDALTAIAELQQQNRALLAALKAARAELVLPLRSPLLEQIDAAIGKSEVA